LTITISARYMNMVPVYRYLARYGWSCLTRAPRPGPGRGLHAVPHCSPPRAVRRVRQPQPGAATAAEPCEEAVSEEAGSPAPPPPCLL
jgi:hypothetical protein